jgi:hypothetical protein
MARISLAKTPQQPDNSHPASPGRAPVSVVDRLDLWFSTGRDVDGLWVGTTEDEPQPGLRRVEDALQLIKQHDPLHYSRIVQHLERIWIRLETTATACYYKPLNACILDKRFVLLEATTLEHIASSIVHEATHARLERWGVRYEEGKRARIEAICLRRELNFVAKLPHSEPLREEIAHTLEWCASDHDYFSDANFGQRELQGGVDALRQLGAPEWIITFVLKARSARSAMYRLRSQLRWRRGKLNP